MMIIYGSSWIVKRLKSQITLQPYSYLLVMLWLRFVVNVVEHVTSYATHIFNHYAASWAQCSRGVLLCFRVLMCSASWPTSSSRKISSRENVQRWAPIETARMSMILCCFCSIIFHRLAMSHPLHSKFKQPQICCPSSTKTWQRIDARIMWAVSLNLRWKPSRWGGFVEKKSEVGMFK